jgi:hypothetical protein
MIKRKFQILTNYCLKVNFNLNYELSKYHTIFFIILNSCILITQNFVSLLNLFKFFLLRDILI